MAAATVGVLVAVALAFTAGDSSATAVAHINDARDDNGASFTTQPTDLVRLDVVWDGASLTVRARYAQAPPSYRLALLISDSAADDRDAYACLANDVIRINVTATPQGTAFLAMPYVGGQIQAPGTMSGPSVTYVFSHPTLTKVLERWGNRDPFVCVSGNADGDSFFGAFTGRVLRVTPTNARTALAAELKRRFGSAFTQATRKWLACPPEELLPATSTHVPQALCEFEFREPGGRFRGGSTSVMVINGKLSAGSDLHSTRYSKAFKQCRVPDTRRGWVNGVYLTDRALSYTESLGNSKTCAQLLGGAGMAADLEYLVASHPGRSPTHAVVGFHGTNRAGFEARASFPCRVNRTGNSFRFDCRNRLGDRFVYSFTLHKA